MTVTRHLKKILLAGCLLLPLLAFAHGDEDHGDGAAPPPAPTQTAAGPRLEANSPDLELVAILQDRELLIYLDHYATNEPLHGAAVELESDGQTLKAEETEAGVYRVAAQALAAPGDHELVITVQTATLDDILIATLTVPSPSAPNQTASAGFDYRLWGGAGLAGLVLIVGLFRLLRRRHVVVLVPAAVALAAASLHSIPGLAHEGEPHDEPAPPPVAAPASAPTRLPDGSLYIPKPAQRLLGIRTLLAEVQELRQSVALNGHVIADPNHSGRVQASQAGRIEPGEAGLPHLGQVVEAGQILAYLAPVASSFELGNQQAQLAELNSQIDLAEKRLRRLEQLSGSVSRKEVEEVRTELEGLRKRRAAVAASLAQREPLRAPVSAVISAANAVPGQVVEAREVLFEIVNPERLWVEAVAYDPALGNQVESATAVTTDGQALRLTFLGMGYQRRGQSLPMQFRIEPPLSALSVGQPVKVLVQTRATLKGIALPQASVVENPGSQPLVWVHESAERFRARQVRVQPLDGRTVVVLEGLTPQDRVVTEGATLLAQVR